MAKIPVYDREVAPQFNPLSYIDSRVNQDTFGGNIAQAQKNVADAMGYLGNEIIEIKDRVDKTKILELKNKSDEWSEQTLYSENGYLRKTGKDAYGQSENILKDYDNYMSDELGKLKLSPANYQLAKTSLGEWRKPLNRTATLHDYKQGINWSQTEIEKSLNNSLLNAVNNRNNPEEMKKALATGFQVIDWGAAIQKSDEATTNYKKQIFSQHVYENVLSGLISDNSLNAVEFFEQNKNKFSPDKVVRLGDSVNTLKRSYYARETAKTLVNLPAEQAYENINAIQDVEDRNSVEREYNRQIRQKEIIENQNKKNILENFYNTVLEKQKKGESISDSDIPNNIDSETKLNLLRFVNSNGNPETDDSTWEMLYEKSVSDAQGFINLDLNCYRGALSESEYKSFIKRQNDIKTGKYFTTIKDDNELIDTALKTMKLDKGKKENVAYSEIRSMVKEFEARRGRKITDNELENIINSLGYKDANGVRLYKQLEKGMGERVGFIRDVINDFTYYQDKHQGAMPSDEEKMKIINKRINSVILRDNNKLQTSLKGSYSVKVGDIWNGHKITSLYGRRNAPIDGATTNHKGIDLAFRNNELFPAFSSGKVVNVGYDKSLGNYVDIEGMDGTIHRYGHANSISVKKGDVVNAGQAIGRAGNTGISTGPHLHYAKISNGNFINPLENNNTMIAQSKKHGWAF